ncbi:MAG TPA: MFS transporter [Solirubrobacteraceae bacterium]|nr:MFS transporter [Solirubrobacteraceae bacterium]
MSARLRYAAVLGTPGVPRLVVTALIARAPIAVNGLALVLFFRAQSGSYAIAGAVAAFYALGAALVAPVMGRLVDRLGAPRVLVPLALAHGALLGALVGLGLAGAPQTLDYAVAVLAGSAIPPAGSVLRALWPSLMDGRPEILTAAYALDAVLLEVAFVAGPLVVAVVATTLSPQAAVVASIVLVVTGTALFSANRAVRAYQPAQEHADDTGGRLGALRSPGVRTIALMQLPIGFCIGAAEVAFPAFCEDVIGNRAAAGPLIALWSLGSAVGGLVYGAHGHRVSADHAFLRTAALLPLVTVPLALPSSFAAMVPLAILSGLAIAPIIASASQVVGQVAPQGALTEAYTWPTTALVGGVAFGNAASGAIVQSAGWREAFVAAAIVGALGAVIGVARRASLRAAVPASVPGG